MINIFIQTLEPRRVKRENKEVREKRRDLREGGRPYDEQEFLSCLNC